MRYSTIYKKIILMHPNKSFGERFLKLAKLEKMPVEIVRFSQCCIILDNKNNIKIFHQNKELITKNAYVFTRIHGPHAFIASLIYEILVQRKVPCNDHVLIYHTKTDKPAQIVRLHTVIPFPSSIICTADSYKSNQSILKRYITYPTVLKGSGRGGDQVWKIPNETELIKKLLALNTTAIIQKFIPNLFDIRVLVFKNTIIGAIKRTAVDGFHNNVCKGATTDTIRLTQKEQKIALVATKKMQIDFAGIDIVRTKKGPYVLEVNKSPMIGGFEKTTGIDVIDKIVSGIIKK